MEDKLILFAFLGGMLPALFWLWFWLKEDRLHPEPRKYIAWTFIIGGLAAILAIPFEMTLYDANNITIFVLFMLASVEEILKYGAAYFSALNKTYVDEPIDAVIYMITAALGFSAIENVIFLVNPSTVESGILHSFIIGNMRFIGATLLHIISSGLIGIFIALSFFNKIFVKRLYLFIGLILSITLHTLFNFSIMFIVNENRERDIFYIFTTVWLGVIILLMLFEKIKQIKIEKI